MQQVKKQLQDAIAELKSGWGINEVKREDLAAVLEKVVAALDRAAQLPELPEMPEPAGVDFDKCFLRVDVISKNASVADFLGENAAEGSTPAVKILALPPMSIKMGFFDQERNKFHIRNSEGNSLINILNGRVLYNDNAVFVAKAKNGELIAYDLYGSELSGYTQANIV